MNRAQKRRLMVVVGALLALAVVIRHIASRTEGPGGYLGAAESTTLSTVPPDPAALRPDLDGERQSALLRVARSRLEGRPNVLPNGFPEAGETRGEDEVAFLSLYRPQGVTLVARGRAPSLEGAVAAAAAELAERASPEEVRQGLIKIDVLGWRGPVERFDGDGRSTIDRSLDGVELPGADDLQLLPEEILSRRLVDSSGDLQSGRLRRYLEEGGRARRELEGNPTRAGSPYRRLRFVSFTESLRSGASAEAQRLYRGNPLEPEVTPASLLAACRAGGDYLLRHQRDDGDFGYSYEPKKDSYNKGYNLLRHAGSSYALAELTQATGDERYLEGSRRAIAALLRRARPPRPEDGADTFRAIVSPGEEAKLGGAALAILAIVEYQKASGDERWLDAAQELARFLVFQQEADGHFFSKYFYGPPDPEPFESIYYPGEAILALARLHRVDGDARWLTTARKGADWLIQVRDAGKAVDELPHDHWLLMGLEELHGLGGEPRYASHAAKIGQAIVQAQRTASPQLDWVGSFYDPPRSTPTATRAEALVAMSRLAAGTGQDPEPYLEALRRMAAFQLRCQLTPSSSFYLPNPRQAAGGFRRSLTNWEVRIDYVQHNVSALLGLRALLLESSLERRIAAVSGVNVAVI